MIKRLISLKAAMLLTACSSAPLPTTKVDATRPANVSFSSLAQQAAPDISISLAYGTAPLQFGRLYLPASIAANTTVPLLVFVHGGCWLNAYDLNHAAAFSQAMAAEGIAVWSVEYRRVGDEGGGWPGSLQDVQQALTFAFDELNSYPLDKHRVAIAGHSAGGQLALLAGANAQAHKLQAVIGLAAITDLSAYAAGNNSCQQATTGFMGGSAAQLPAQYKLASPQSQLLPDNALLLHGSSDTIVPVNQATTSGIRYQIIENAGHFDWLHPKTQAFSSLLKQLQEQFAK